MALLRGNAASCAAEARSKASACAAQLTAGGGRLLWPGKLVRLMLVVGFVVTILGVNSTGQSRPVPEYQVKAAFLYNFAKFVEWPADALPTPPSSLKLCVLGEDPFGEELERTVQGKTVSGRGLTVARFSEVGDTRGCHILFISSSERREMRQILAGLKGSSVLTVGELGEFARLGGVINFTLQGGKVGFEINVDAAEQARLKISSKLLSLARVIRGERGAGGS